METTAARFSAKDMAYIAVFTALLAVCSWIAIPMPWGVAYTLQTLGVFLAVGVLGGKRGTLAVVVYLLLGAMGVPVFSGFQGGTAALLGTTGGYIAGFLFSALAMWMLEKLLGRSLPALALSMVLGWRCAMPSAPPGTWRSIPGLTERWRWGRCWAGAWCPTLFPIW